MSEYKINKKLWSDEFHRQMVNSLSLGRRFYSKEKRDMTILQMFKQKYFAVRVPDLEEAEKNQNQLIDFSLKAGKPLARAIEKDIVGFMRDNLFGDMSCSDSINELLELIDNNQIVFFLEEDIDVQSACDLDYLSYSVVGRCEFKVGITNKPKGE